MFITAVLTSSVTLLGVWFTNRANIQRIQLQLDNEKENRYEELFREQLEELYIQSNRYLSSLWGHYLPYAKVMNGELTFNQALDMTIERASKKDYDPNRVTMLINMYFPQIKPEFEKIIDIRNKLNRIIDKFKAQYKTGTPDGTRWLQAFQPLFEEFSILSDNFDKHIVNLK